jgi:hypothetical protein
MWISLGVMMRLIITQTVYFGIPNRTFMVSFALRLILAGRPLAGAGTRA